MRSYIIPFLVGGTLAIAACGRSSPVGPKEGDVETNTSTRTENFSRRFDVNDNLWRDEIANRLEGVRQDLSGLSITPDTLTANGQNHILGYNVSGRKVVQVTETKEWKRDERFPDNIFPSTRTESRDLTDPLFERVQRDLDRITDGTSERLSYKRFGDDDSIVLNDYKLDTPNIANTPDVVKRLEDFNSRKGGRDFIIFPIYLKHNEGGVSADDEGYPIIDGLSFVPLMSGAGYTGMEYDAMEALTGDSTLNWRVRLGPLIRLKVYTSDEFYRDTTRVKTPKEE